MVNILHQTREIAKTQREIARRLREADAKRWTQEAVRALLGVAQQTVAKWFTNTTDGNGKSPPPDARVKLSMPAKAEIVRRIEAGEKQEQICTLLGIGQQTVSDWFSDLQTQDSKSQPRVDARVKLAKPAKVFPLLGSCGSCLNVMSPRQIVTPA